MYIYINPDHTHNIWNKFYQMCFIWTQYHWMSISLDHFLTAFDWLSCIRWEKQRVSELKMEGNILCVVHLTRVYFPIPK